MPKRVRAIIIEDGKVLLMHRIKNGLEYWAFPGGAIDGTDKDPEDALKRECKEELGVEVLVVDFYMETKSKAPTALGDIEHFYNCKIIGGVVGTGEGEEFTNRDIEKYGTYKVEWLPLNTIKDKNVWPIEVRDKILLDRKIV